MEDYDVPSAASILASVKEQEARFERLTRALEEERRNVSLQLERGSLPSDRLLGGNTGGTNQPLAWQQMVMQVKPAIHRLQYVNQPNSLIPHSSMSVVFMKSVLLCLIWCELFLAVLSYCSGCGPTVTLHLFPG